MKTMTNILDKSIIFEVEQKEYVQQKLAWKSWLKACKSFCLLSKQGFFSSNHLLTILLQQLVFLYNLSTIKVASKPWYIYSYFFPTCSLLMECQSWHSLLIHFSFVFHSQNGNSTPLLDGCANELACAYFATMIHLFHERTLTSQLLA
jgi:hypothetical protein